jgi:hypothetical protein
MDVWPIIFVIVARCGTDCRRACLKLGRCVAEGVFELFKSLVEFGRIGDGGRLHAKFLDSIFQTLNILVVKALAFYRATLLRLGLES